MLTVQRKVLAYGIECSKGLPRFLPRLTDLQVSKDPGQAAARPVQTYFGR